MNKLLLLLCTLTTCYAADILYAIPFTSKSHYMMLKSIGLELARRGHNVTVLTAFEEDDHPPSYHQVIGPSITIWEAMNGGRPNVFNMIDVSEESFHNNVLWKGGLAYTKEFFKSDTIQNFLNETRHYDLVIAEQFYEESLYALAHKYNTPLVLVTTFGNCMRHNILARNPLQMATVTSEFLVVKDTTSFFGRLRNFQFTVYEFFWWYIWYMPQHEAIITEYIKGLPQPVPSLVEMQKNASLILLNSHFSYDVPAAYAPNIIEIGGIHLDEPNIKQLPADLKLILDGAKHGVVYMSLGSNVKSAELPKEKVEIFLKVFGQLNETVLWKWEDDSIQNIPENVHLRKWVPQKEILAHPNVKVFIAHGGLIGFQEATYYGVPIIGIPVYADQYNNLLEAQKAGYGKILSYHDLSEDALTGLLTEVLKSSYKSKALEVSRRFRDRPMKALDTAMYWIEYVIRHNGADFIKNPAIDLSWLAFSMLDVYCFVLAVIVLSAFLAYKVLSLVLNVGRGLLGGKVSRLKKNN